MFEGESEDLKPRSEEYYENFFVDYGGESASQVRERMVKTCTEIMEQDDHNIVLAVSHGLSSFCFLTNWQDGKEERRKGIPNCCIFKYEYENKEFKLVEIIRHDFTQIQESLAY